MDAGIDPNTMPPDLLTKVTSSISGFVTGENDAALAGATVKVGTAYTITDHYGYFEIKTVQVVKEAATVAVSYPGYFKGIKTYLAIEGKAAFFRIKLLRKTIAGSINASSGGNVTLPNGLNIFLPADAVKNAATGSAYSGTVNVSAQWIDPTSAELNKIMPGDLRGINTAGLLKGLTTYGMLAVELTGSSGELLQIADGKRSTITMPVPASLLSTAPSTIPLWYFDETTGLWKEEGTATRTGNNYVGEVSHFSFWNCDVPGSYVQFDCTVKDQAGNPIPQALVKITDITTSQSRFGYTDAAGFVSGAVPDNAQLKLDILINQNCGLSTYTQNFTTTNINVSLGVITINFALGTATVSGSVTDCFNNPVTNGYIILSENNQYYRYPVSNTGAFSFVKLLCNNTSNVTLVAEDVNGLQVSNVINQTLVPGPNTIGNMQACGISTQEFVTHTVNGGAPITYTSPTDSIDHVSSGINNQNFIHADRFNFGFIQFTFSNNNISGGSTQNLISFLSSQSTGPYTISSIPMPINVNITEYGAVGQFISGNFSGLITTNPILPNFYNVTCSFRVRRTF